MSISWAESYAGHLRTKVGHDPLIVPSIRAIIRDDRGRVLFLKGKGWVMPAGSIELGESIQDTLKREVKEETGLEVQAATLIAMYTSKPVMTNKFGDQYQMFEFLFRVDKWAGVLFDGKTDYKEGAFFSIGQLPVSPDQDDFWANHFRDVFDDLKRYDGELILK